MELAVVAGCWLFLLAYFKPELLLSPSITTGGDTGSHYYTAVYLRDVLLPSGRILGWNPGNLAGYPIFQFYFPLPFLAMVALSLAMPLSVAFKLITAGAVFALPLCAWLGLRLARAPFPAPALAAVAVLPFLFNQTNSAFGGNLPSLLAGEFTFAWSLALLLVFMGVLAGDLAERRHPLRAALLLAATGFCHGGPLLFGVLAGGLFLFSREFPRRLVYLAKVYGLAFCFMGWWIVPLLVFAKYNSPHNMVWIISDWHKVLPPILWPAMGLALLHLAWSLWRRLGQGRTLGAAAFCAGCVILSALLYLVAFHINVIDIRFLPFGWLALCMWAAWALGQWLRRTPAAGLIPLLLLVLTILGIGYQVDFIPKWIQWNYSGFEATSGWDHYRELNTFLKGGPADPRAAYEHSALHRRAGTVRALESLPLFSGRSTLEGLYIQSSPNSPFIFYLQSLTCKSPSTPITSISYAGFDLARALPRLRLYNTSQLVVVTAATRKAAFSQKGLLKQAQIGPYSVFKVLGNQGYVTPLKFKPVLITGPAWKMKAFDWFRLGDLAVPLVFASRREAGDPSRFAAIDPLDIKRLPRQPLPPARVKARVGFQEIEIETSGRGPLLVKMSYHPNWKVEGAERVFLASPAFMLIFPKQDKVRLYFGQTWPNYLGQALFVLALALGLGSLPGVRSWGWVRRRRQRVNGVWQATGESLEGWLGRPLSWCSAHAGVLALAGLLLVAGGSAAYVGLGLKEDSTVAFNRGLSAFEIQDYGAAERHFRRAMQRFPRSPIIDQTMNHYALSLYLQEKYEPAIKAFARLAELLPESVTAPDALFHIGECQQRLKRPGEARAAWLHLIELYPASRWAGYARDRLKAPAE
jgi:6-pyruvoyl-tetrahydropterin synthase-like protein/tetratricopeptide repeat protein